MSRRRRESPDRIPDISPLALALLYDKPLTEEQRKSWELYCLQDGPCGEMPTLEDLWRLHGEAITAEMAERNPGKRLTCWWKWSAPVCNDEGMPVDRPRTYIEPTVRMRLGGTGTYWKNWPCHLGIPIQWHSEWEVEYYNGRAVDVHGKPIGTTFSEGYFKGAAPDPNDMPVYESQAAFLARLGLLLPGEADRLTEPDYAPEVLDWENVHQFGRGLKSGKRRAA